LLLIALGLAAYLNSFSGTFVLDDQTRIVDNAQIRHFWPPWRVMAHTSRPVVQLSLAINYALGGLNVWGYHAFNLAVHLLAGLLLFGIVRRTLESEPLRARYAEAAPWLAVAVAALWLVHPLHTESVTYIIQRAEALMGLFFLLTLYCLVRGSLSPHPQAWYLAAVLASALGVGSKEVMAAAPLVALLYDRVFLSPSFKTLFRERWRLYFNLAATWAILGALLVTSRQEGQTVLVAGLTPWRYAVTQFGVIAHYLRLALWPHPLVLDYTWPLAETVTSVAPEAAVVLALLAGTLWALRRRPPLGFLGAWFFLILAPTSSIFPIADVAFEHRMYLPLAAVVALGVFGAHEALRRLATADALRRGLAVGLLGMAVIALTGATARRNEDYRSEFSIWSDTVAKRRDNPRAQSNLGVILQGQGKSREALAQYYEALRLRPDYPDPHNNIGVMLAAEGRIDEAIAHYSEALRLAPYYPDAHSNLGVALLGQGRIEEAIAHFSMALRVQPDNPDAHNNLGAALSAQGRVREATAHFSEALRLNPAHADAHNNVGTALLGQGRVEEAVAHFSEALRLKPAFSDAHYNLGLAMQVRGDTQGAIAQYSQAVRLSPDNARAHNDLGLALYGQGQIREAMTHFAEAARLRPDFAAALENLRKAQASQLRP
jgi:tetratricopeptide (TPR) repeat protein